MEPAKPEEMHEGGSRYVPTNKKDHERPIVQHNYVDHEDEGMDTHTHTRRYVPANKKDHERPIVKHKYIDHEDEGMDTHTRTKRYVPAGQKPFLFGLFGKKKE